jgi:hypothetical protein
MNSMNKLIFSARYFVLSVIILFGACLTAMAQTITLNGSGTAAANATSLPTAGSPGYACVDYSLASPLTNEQTFVFTPGSNNEVVEKWTIQGEGVASTGNTGNTFKFYPTGFGKARVTLSYYYDNGTHPVYCGGTQLQCNGVGLTEPNRAYASKSFDFFKNFTQAQAAFLVKGPTCVPAGNPSVVYSVDPAIISTISQIQSGAGVDDYTWNVIYNITPPNGIPDVPHSFSGDYSAIIIPGSALTGSFIVKVQVGKCNPTIIEVPVSVASALNPTASLTNFPTCYPIGTIANTTFTLNTVANVTYTLNTSIGLLSTSSSTPALNLTIAGTGSGIPITLSGITATNTGSVTITGVGNGGCFGTQTIIQPVTRQLVAAQNVITPTACVAPSSSVVISLSNAPEGVVWTATNGWTLSNPTYNPSTKVSTITAATNTSGSVVTAQAGTCNVGGTGIISKTFNVTGQVAGCSFTVAPSAEYCATYGISTSGTCASGNKYVQWKLEENVGGTWVQRDVYNPVGGAQNGVSWGFYNWTSSIAAPNARVTVRVTNANNCLDYPYYYYGSFDVCPERHTLSTGSATTGEHVQVYPNPVGNQLNIDLKADLTKGVAKVTLLDALGRVCQKTTTAKPNTTLDVRRVTEGLYTLRVELPNGQVLSQSVQVQH